MAPRDQLEQRLGRRRSRAQWRVGLIEEADGRGEANIRIPVWVDSVALTCDRGSGVAKNAVTSI